MERIINIEDRRMEELKIAIGKLANMPCGYVAERESAAAKWVTHKEKTL